MKKIICLFAAVWLTGCSVSYKNQMPIGESFPTVTGNTLEGQTITLPNELNNKLTLLLVAYKQRSQFDVDRWLIGLDMTNTDVAVYEVPTLRGMFPEIFSTVIDEGMRSGIPKELWQGVITVYEDGDKIQSFTGNEKPNNTRVVLLDDKGKVLYFYDRGFSVNALNELRAVIKSNAE
ncbi:MAG: hypothetical protein HWE10_08410 [Gammaproteobacteria bacterium]|nr:hypothetical protein [Gammaproteobacteria bacterium]